MTGDLHCHTRFSDGSVSAEELVRLAKRAGLDYVAVTDHDCVLPKSEAQALYEKYGAHVIHGAELSCIDPSTGRKVHMLCLLPEKTDRLDTHCREIQAAMDAAGIKMAQKVSKLFPVTLEEITEYKRESKSIFKQHIMRALAERGFTLDFYDELYKELFNEKSGSCYEYVDYPDVDFILGLLHESEGTAILAHPKVYKSMELAKALAKSGKIQGVEVYHHSADEEARSTLSALCKENGLIMTGGSDFHGMYSASPRTLGSNKTDEENLLRIIKKEA